MSEKGRRQEARFYGGRVFCYSSFLFFVVSCFCLGGFPFFVGFYSKDFIIRGSGILGGLLYFVLFIVGCLFTVLYRIRLVLSSFVLFYRFLPVFYFGERFYFSFSVALLFFKGWILGGVFY